MKLLLWVVVLILATLTGCIGPIDYLNTVARKARRAVAEAQTANAEKLSPYEYWSAVTYLHMAREKVARADFEHANRYGRKAVEMGELAKKQSTEKASEGPTATPTRPDEAPVSVEESKPASKGE